MNRKRLLVIGLLSTLGIGAASGGIYAMQSSSLSHGSGAHGPGLAAAPFMVGSMGHGWRGHKRGGPGGHVCRAANGERLDDAIGFVESFVDFTPEQSAAWQDLTAALHGGQERVRSACDEIEQAEETRRAPDRLARAEVMLSTGLGVVQQVRPAFAAFYDSLDEGQREAIDKLFSRRHGHRRDKQEL